MPPAPSARHEYSSLDVTVELVSSIDEAIDHIHGHGSGVWPLVAQQRVLPAKCPRRPVWAQSERWVCCPCCRVPKSGLCRGVAPQQRPALVAGSLWRGCRSLSGAASVLGVGFHPAVAAGAYGPSCRAPLTPLLQGTPSASSQRTMRRPTTSCAAWTRRACFTTRRHASPTATASAWAQRWARARGLAACCVVVTLLALLLLALACHPARLTRSAGCPFNSPARRWASPPPASMHAAPSVWRVC